MLLIRLILVVLALVVNIEQAIANTISQQTTVNIINVQYLIEDQVPYDFQRVLSFDESRWHGAKSYPLNLGNLRQGAWVRFNLNNIENQTAKRIIEFSNPDLHKLTIFKQTHNDQFTHLDLGSYLPFIERPILSRNFAIPIQLEAKESIRFYVRAESNVGLLIPIAVREESEFWYLANVENIGYGLYFGILIMFIAFNAGMYLVRNDYVFLLLVLDLLLFGLMYANHLGLNFEYLWPVDPQFNYLAGVFFGYLVVIAANVFTWHFLQPEPTRVRLVFYYAFNTLPVIGIVLLWLIPFSFSSSLGALLGAGAALFFVALTLHKWRSSAEFSKYYLISYGFAAIASFIYIAHKLAWLPTHHFTLYALGYSVLLQAIVLTCVLIERKKVVKKIIGFEGGSRTIPNSTRDWIAQFSHEIRTPLSGIVGMTDLLKETPLNPTQYNYVRVLTSSGKHLMELVGDVLDYESLASGEVELVESVFNLQQLCEQTLSMFEQQAAEKGLQIDLDLDAGLADEFVGDSTRLKQILINLLSNAVKFTHQGSVRIVAKSAGDSGLVLSVTDTGIGMAKQQQQGIFERFRQADQSIYSKYGGSGLGLAICRQLVGLMGGEISVQSKLGEFTRFTLKLPLQPVLALENKVDNESSYRDSNTIEVDFTHSISQLDGHGYSNVGVELVVLGVDDNEINRRVLRAMLKKLGHQMIEASSGQEALDIIKSGVAIDLIMMDCEMPMMNGFETTESIRKWQYGQAVKPCPIIALTAHVLDEHKERCMAAGMDGHLSKPLHLEELKNLLVV